MEILGELGVDGWSVADVARRQDIARQKIYKWRRALKRKGLWPTEVSATFVEVPTPDALPETCPLAADGGAASSQVRIVLRSGREVPCGANLDDAAPRRLLHILETS